MPDNFKNLKAFRNNLEELSKTTSVPLTDVYSDSFFQSYTQFQSFQDFLDKGGFVVESEEDLKNISSDDLNRFTRENTNFEDFSKLQQKAAGIFASKMLSKGFK